MYADMCGRTAAAMRLFEPAGCCSFVPGDDGCSERCGQSVCVWSYGVSRWQLEFPLTPTRSGGGTRASCAVEIMSMAGWYSGPVICRLEVPLPVLLKFLEKAPLEYVEAATEQGVAAVFFGGAAVMPASWDRGASGVLVTVLKATSVRGEDGKCLFVDSAMARLWGPGRFSPAASASVKPCLRASVSQ